MIPVHDRRLMLVHAHPDDETIGNGVTMARVVAEGGQVTLVTCTLGEEGEVLVPELVHLDADHEDALAAQDPAATPAGDVGEAAATSTRRLVGRLELSGWLWSSAMVALEPPFCTTDQCLGALASSRKARLRISSA